MNKSPIFILGLRRSGSSILRELLLKHQEIQWLDFEPHELFFVIESSHIGRYKNSEYHKKVLERYNGNPEYFTGAKIAVNCGIEAMRWKRLKEKFDSPYFVFIIRNCEDTFNSWYKIDNKPKGRGIVPFNMYEPWWKHINQSFYEFIKNNPRRAVMINYEEMVRNADNELEYVWGLLNIKPIKNLNRFLRIPENTQGILK